MTQRKVNHRHPKHGEQYIRAELDPLGDCAADQRRRDDRKHHLEQHETLLRNRRGVIGVGRAADVLEQEILVRVSKERVAFAKGHAVAVNHPQRRYDRHENQAVSHGRKDVFAPHQAAIKQDQPGRGHHQHQRGTDQQPRVVSGVDGGRRRRGVCRFKPGYPLFEG